MPLFTSLYTSIGLVEPLSGCFGLSTRLLQHIPSHTAQSPFCLQRTQTGLTVHHYMHLASLPGATPAQQASVPDMISTLLAPINRLKLPSTHSLHRGHFYTRLGGRAILYNSYKYRNPNKMKWQQTIYKIKEQEKSLEEGGTKEIEICNLPHKEFKEMVIRVLTKLESEIEVSGKNLNS